MALSPWVRTIAYCEIEPYCQSILMQRMSEGYLSKAPIWDDIKTFPIRSSCDPFTIDIIFGGFPCQDISVAGAGKGLAGERSGLFFEISRLASEIKPRWLFLENVPAITTRGGTEVVRTLTQMGYDCRWCVISAASVGALHRRERWFLLAHSNSERCDKEQRRQSFGLQETYSESTDCDSQNGSNSLCLASEQANQEANTKQSERNSWGEHTGFYWPFESREHWQETLSSMDKCTHGLPYMVDRLRSLGNSVVPQQVRKAFKILMGIK